LLVCWDFFLRGVGLIVCFVCGSAFRISSSIRTIRKRNGSHIPWIAVVVDDLLSQLYTAATMLRCSECNVQSTIIMENEHYITHFSSFLMAHWDWREWCFDENDVIWR
jgi:hypothetical protein